MKAGKILHEKHLHIKQLSKFDIGVEGRKFSTSFSLRKMKHRYFASGQHSVERYRTGNVLSPSTLRIPRSPPGS